MKLNFGGAAPRSRALKKEGRLWSLSPLPLTFCALSHYMGDQSLVVPLQRTGRPACGECSLQQRRARQSPLTAAATEPAAMRHPLVEHVLDVFGESTGQASRRRDPFPSRLRRLAPPRAPPPRRLWRDGGRGGHVPTHSRTTAAAARSRRRRWGARTPTLVPFWTGCSARGRGGQRCRRRRRPGRHRPPQQQQRRGGW